MGSGSENREVDGEGVDRMRETFLLLAILLTLPGCIWVREGNLPHPAQWPPQHNMSDKKSISLEIPDFANTGNLSREVAQNIVKTWREEAFKVYTESGLFSTVKTTGAPSDIFADITIEVTIKGERARGIVSSLYALISTFTLRVIPGYAPEDITVKTIYKDRDQKVLASLDKKEELGIWISFFLLFAMPFIDEPNKAVKEVYDDLHRLTIDEAHAMGVF